MKKVVIGILLIGCGIWLYYILNIDDFAQADYKSYKEIDFEKGWIPKDIPSSSYDIHEVHNIDTNELLIWFKSDDFKAFLSGCQKVNIKTPFSKTTSLRKFKSTVDLALHEVKKDFTFYSCSYNKNYVNAINEKSHKAYIFEK